MSTWIVKDSKGRKHKITADRAIGSGEVRFEIRDTGGDITYWTTVALFSSPVWLKVKEKRKLPFWLAFLAKLMRKFS